MSVTLSGGITKCRTVSGSATLSGMRLTVHLRTLTRHFACGVLLPYCYKVQNDFISVQVQCLSRAMSENFPTDQLAKNVIHGPFCRALSQLVLATRVDDSLHKWKFPPFSSFRRWFRVHQFSTCNPGSPCILIHPFCIPPYLQHHFHTLFSLKLSSPDGMVHVIWDYQNYKRKGRRGTHNAQAAIFGDSFYNKGQNKGCADIWKSE